MRTICPTSENHKEFYTTAHVVQNWKVNETGEFLEVKEDCIEVASPPDKDNVWVCAICGKEAKVIDD